MASVLLHSTSLSSTSRFKCHKLLLPVPTINLFSFQHKPVVKKPKSLLSFPTFLHPGRPKFTVTGASWDDFLGKIEKDESLSSEEKPMKFLFWALLWASVSLGLHALSGNARAAAAIGGGAADSIRGSGFGVKVANALRAWGWADEAVVFALATLPVILGTWFLFPSSYYT